MDRHITLEPYGLPIEMSVPHGAKIMEMDLIVTKDIEIKTNGFYLQLLTLPIESDTTINTLANILHSVQSDADFLSLIEENENGFIYEKKNKAGKSVFNFRHLIQLDSLIIMAKASDSMGDVVPMSTRRERTEQLRILSEKKKAAFYHMFEETERVVLFESHSEDGMVSGFTDNYLKITMPGDAELVNTLGKVSLRSYQSETGSMKAFKLMTPEKV